MVVHRTLKMMTAKHWGLHFFEPQGTFLHILRHLAIHLGLMGGAKRSGNGPSGTWGPWCNFVSVASTEILHFRRSAACRGWIAWLCIEILGVSKETKQGWCKTSQAFPSLSPCSAAFKNNSAAFKQSRATEKIRSQMHNYVDSLANKSTEFCRWGGSGLAVE